MPTATPHGPPGGLAAKKAPQSPGTQKTPHQTADFAVLILSLEVEQTPQHGGDVLCELNVSTVPSGRDDVREDISPRSGGDSLGHCSEQGGASQQGRGAGVRGEPETPQAACGRQDEPCLPHHPRGGLAPPRISLSTGTRLWAVGQGAPTDTGALGRGGRSAIGQGGAGGCGVLEPESTASKFPSAA